MPEEYEALLADMLELTKEATTAQAAEALPVAEDGWDTRPDADSYGEIALEFEAESLDGDNEKQQRSFEGSVDLYSRKRDGDGWIQLIEQCLTKHCGASWVLNYHGYERETALSHWEWAFQVEG